MSDLYCTECDCDLESTAVEIGRETKVGIICECGHAWQKGQPVPASWLSRNSPTEAELLELASNYDGAPYELGDTTSSGTVDMRGCK